MVPSLDRLDLVVIVDNETDTLSSIDAGIPQQPESVDLLGRIEPCRIHDGEPGISVFEHLCVACHGLSVLATAVRGDTQATVLFDVGPDGEVWRANAQRLGIDLAAIECVFLSHWHADHSGGLPVAIAAIAEARARAGLTPPIVDVHPARPDQRGVRSPAGFFALLPPEPTLDDLRAAGGEVVTHADAHAVAGLLYGSGEIARVTSYETGLPGHHSFYGDECRADPLILDERFLAADVRGRGITVLSACSHAGVVNACLAGKAAFPNAPFDMILGGFHLAGAAMEPRIDQTVADLARRVGPRLVAPGHCTGWRAKTALANTFAPGRFAPSVVGTRYRLGG